MRSVRDRRRRQQRRRRVRSGLTYTLNEAARRLGISRALAYEAAHRGELPVCRIGRRVLVPRAALLRLLEDGPADSQSA
jgi:excisionase family DNA binding protein